MFVIYCIPSCHHQSFLPLFSSSIIIKWRLKSNATSSSLPLVLPLILQPLCLPQKTRRMKWKWSRLQQTGSNLPQSRHLIQVLVLSFFSYVVEEIPYFPLKRLNVFIFCAFCNKVGIALEYLKIEYWADTVFPV